VLLSAHDNDETEDLATADWLTCGRG